MEVLSEEDVRAALRKRIGRRTQREAAEVLGVSQGQLSHILRGRRTPGEDVLKALGLTWRMVRVTAPRGNGRAGKRKETLTGYCDCCGALTRGLVEIKQRGISGLCACPKCLGKRHEEDKQPKEA